VSELVLEARKDFRQRNSIGDDSFVILLAPGDSTKAIDFMFKSVVGGVRKFLDDKEVASYGKANFHLLVLSSENKVPYSQIQKHEDLIKSKANTLRDKIDVTLVKPEDKYGALSAADYGIVSDGEIAVEAAACQLAATTIN
jgi:hypothetical protein